MIKNRFPRGFYLLEAIVMMSIIVSLMGFGSRYITQNAERTVNQITAKQLQQVTQAAQQYVQDHYQTFKVDPNTTFQHKDLVTQGYLSDTVSDQNNYGQTYKIKVLEENGLLQVVLTTEEGKAINEPSLRQIAALAGSTAGYASVLDKDKITGNQQSWFLEGIPLKLGHLASLTIVSEKEVMDAATFLRRRSFPGHPEYNQMESDLLMGGHTVQMKEGNYTAGLNRYGLIFEQSKSRIIGIFNSQYPHIKIEDNTLDIPNTMSLNSADLYFTKGNHKVHVGVDRPQMVIEDKTKTWSSQITPAEIRLESQASGNKSYIANDMIVLQNEKYKWSSNLRPAELEMNNSSTSARSYINTDKIGFTDRSNSIQMSANSLTTGKYPYSTMGKALISDYRGLFSEVASNYLKIPFIEVYEQSSWTEDLVQICGPKEKEGALFLIGVRGKGWRRIIVCADGRARQIESWG